MGEAHLKLYFVAIEISPAIQQMLLSIEALCMTCNPQGESTTRVSMVSTFVRI